MIDAAAIRTLRDAEDADEVTRAVCDLALTGETEHPYALDMSRESARRWCVEAIAARDDERPVGIPGAIVGRP